MESTIRSTGADPRRSVGGPYNKNTIELRLETQKKSSRDSRTKDIQENNLHDCVTDTKNIKLCDLSIF